MKKDSNQKSLEAWGMLSVIVAQLVIAPGVLGGAAFFIYGKLMEKYGWDKTAQYVVTLFAALIGLGIAFYRIIQISNQLDKKSDENDRLNQ